MTRRLKPRPRKASAWSGNQHCSGLVVEYPIMKLTQLIKLTNLRQGECREVRPDRDDRDRDKMNSDADVERIITDEIISGGKITKVLTPTMLLL